MNGRICLSSKTCFDTEESTLIRAVRIVTLLHEIFAHKKRREYVIPHNILKFSPEALKCSHDKAPEAGFYLETEIFG